MRIQPRTDYEQFLRDEELEDAREMEAVRNFYRRESSAVRLPLWAWLTIGAMLWTAFGFGLHWIWELVWAAVTGR